MTLDAAGLGLAILFELCRTVKGMRERSACFKEGLILCDELDATLERLTALAKSIDDISRSNPETMPPAVLPDFKSTLKTVKETLLRVDSGLTEYCSKASIGRNNSSCFAKVSARGKRILRARSLKASLSDIQSEMKDAEKKLQYLFTQLCGALKVDEALLNVDRNIRDLILEHVCQKERFRPAFNAPMLPANICLDMDSRNADGSFCTPEAKLKSFVFASTCQRHVTVARGATPPPGRQPSVHGVSGMGGVGKTMALIGLGHDEDIKAHFVDGVLYMSIGANATVGHITTELWKILSVSGAIASAEAVQSSTSLSDAITIASVWFHGKRVLFLVDDIWPMSTRPEGYLPDLELLLQGSPDSRMAITTRSWDIARKSGSHVDFGTRDPCGPSALAMFLAHGLPGTPSSGQLLESVRSVLLLCDGLPISLAVAGAAVSRRTSPDEELADTCQAYVASIQDQISRYPGASFLHNAVRLSLATLEEDRKRNIPGMRTATNNSLSELFESLCVLENQQFAPVSVLAKMWGTSDAHAEDVCISFKSMSLAKISFQVLDGRKQRGLSIHDLHLDYCCENANLSNVLHSWHRRLLNGHLTFETSASKSIANENVHDLSGFNILQYTPRQWWKDDIPNKEYIRNNVPRHLQRAGLELELGATVLDLRWISAQGVAGGVLQLKNDLDILRETVHEKATFADTNVPRLPVTIIFKVIVGLGDVLRDGIRSMSHQFLTRLSVLGETNEWIRRFLERVKETTPTPFLLPTLTSYRYPGEDLKWTIGLNLPGQKGFSYSSTDFSRCDKYCAAGANYDVAVYDLKSHSRVQWLKGHEQNVSVVKFSSDASMLVSGSFDKRVIIWDWKKTEFPHRVFQGHEGPVSSLSLSGNDSRLFSGSLDGTVRVWDLMTGTFIREIVHSSAVECISSCPTNDLIAVGTRDGYLRCTNSESQECVFVCSLGNASSVSAVEFGPDGNSLISGTAAGNATCWRTANWEKPSTVSVTGSVTQVSFHPDGTNVILGTSHGEVRHWYVSEKQLSKYNVSVARPLTGLSFHENGNCIVLAQKLGAATAWSGPNSNPNLDFSAYQNNILFDFDLSADGTRVATSTRDGMIRLWNTDNGDEISAYSTPADGSLRLALSADGRKIASSSTAGMILVWNSDTPSSDADVSFRVDKDDVRCLSLSPDGETLLVCLENEVEIWKIDGRAGKLGDIPNFGSLDTSFSADGKFVIVGNLKRTNIWDATERKKVFDSEELLMEGNEMSLTEAKQVVRTCGASGHRMWPASRRTTGSVSCPGQSGTSITMDNVFSFVSCHFRPSTFLFSKNVFALNFSGRLSMYRICE